MQVQMFIERLLGHMGVEGAEVSITEEGDKIFVQIAVAEEDSGLLIGYHGDVLAAIQKISQLVYRTDVGEDGDKRVVVNVNDYKQRRENQLVEMVERIAQRVLETGEEYVFAFLPANERLVVHQTISEREAFVTLESVSIGEGSDRRLHLRVKAA